MTSTIAESSAESSLEKVGPGLITVPADESATSIYCKSPFARNQAEETDQSLVVVRHRPHDRVLVLIRRALYPIVAQ
jgi:hypothetical protein